MLFVMSLASPLRGVLSPSLLCGVLLSLLLYGVLYGESGS